MEEPSNPTDPLAEAAKETAALVDSPLAEALEGDALSGDIHALEGDATKAWADIQQFIADGRKRIDAALAPIAGAQPSVAAAISAAFHELMQHVATKHPAAPAPPSDGSAAE